MDYDKMNMIENDDSTEYSFDHLSIVEPALEPLPSHSTHTMSEDPAGLMPVILGDMGDSTSAIRSASREPLAASTVNYYPNVADDTTFYLQVGSQRPFSMEVDPPYNVSGWGMSSNGINGVPTQWYESLPSHMLIGNEYGSSPARSSNCTSPTTSVLYTSSNITTSALRRTCSEPTPEPVVMRNITSRPTIASITSTDQADVYVFECSATNCHKTFGRWYDFKRHYDGAHSSEGPEHWCTVGGCDRSKAVGGRPFPRKDKLNDHVKKMHGCRAVMCSCA